MGLNCPPLSKPMFLVASRLEPPAPAEAGVWRSDLHAKSKCLRTPVKPTSSDLNPSHAQRHVERGDGQRVYQAPRGS